MSIETWKKEFYPETAEEVAAKGNVKAALEHSLKKWEGLRVENLNKHDLSKGTQSRMIKFWPHPHGGGDLQMFPVEGSNCALCQMYMYGEQGYANCDACPLEDCDPEYATFFEVDDPEPMIALLKQKLEEI